MSNRQLALHSDNRCLIVLELRAVPRRFTAAPTAARLREAWQEQRGLAGRHERNVAGAAADFIHSSIDLLSASHPVRRALCLGCSLFFVIL